jgi:hypothetical protein
MKRAPVTNYLTDLGWVFAFILCVALGICLFKGVGLLLLHLGGVR